MMKKRVLSAVFVSCHDHGNGYHGKPIRRGEKAIGER